MKNVECYRVKPGSKVDLDKWDPGDKSCFSGGKTEGRKVLQELTARLQVQQEILYAENKHKLLVVLQAMDTGGKDGTIRSIFQHIDPHGIRIANFKAPTEPEIGRDYLWRIHQQVPKRGEIVIFNRSHYEDVLVVRVHNLVSRKVWIKRYGHINEFERMLVDEGTTILKFYLHIDKEEQRRRLQARLSNPDKHWKFSRNDLEERRLWSRYRKAYEQVLSRTSTKYAPWYIVPSNRKWYRDLVVGTILTDTLESLRMQFPVVKINLADVIVD